MTNATRTFSRDELNDAARIAVSAMRQSLVEECLHNKLAVGAQTLSAADRFIQRTFVSSFPTEGMLLADMYCDAFDPRRTSDLKTLRAALIKGLRAGFSKLGFELLARRTSRHLNGGNSQGPFASPPGSTCIRTAI